MAVVKKLREDREQFLGLRHKALFDKGPVQAMHGSPWRGQASLALKVIGDPEREKNDFL